MDRDSVISAIRATAIKVIPPDGHLYLYGSRARGDYRDDSDWDMLLLLNKEIDENADYKNFAYPIMQVGFDLNQYFSIQIYGIKEWQGLSFLPYYKNVEHDKIQII